MRPSRALVLAEAKFHFAATLTSALLFCVAFGAPARADVPPAIFPTESRPTASRLADARKLISEKKWSEAVNELQAILDGSGSDLVAVTPRYSVPARRQCHR